jgi:hypothetical protein
LAYLWAKLTGGEKSGHLLPLGFFKKSKLKREGNIPNINTKNKKINC